MGLQAIADGTAANHRREKASDQKTDRMISLTGQLGLSLAARRELLAILVFCGALSGSELRTPDLFKQLIVLSQQLVGLALLLVIAPQLPHSQLFHLQLLLHLPLKVVLMVHNQVHLPSGRKLAVVIVPTMLAVCCAQSAPPTQNKSAIGFSENPLSAASAIITATSVSDFIPVIDIECGDSVRGNPPIGH
jgi:hypothetical protein